MTLHTLAVNMHICNSDPSLLQGLPGVAYNISEYYWHSHLGVNVSHPRVTQ